MAHRARRHLRRATTCRRAMQWPEFLFDSPDLQFPEQLNCASELLDRWVASGQGDRAVHPGPRRALDLCRPAGRRRTASPACWSRTWAWCRATACCCAAPTRPMLAACWFAVVKAGGIAVGTMPLLRAKELTQIVAKAQVSHALCDARLAEELSAGAAGLPDADAGAALQLARCRRARCARCAQAAHVRDRGDRAGRHLHHRLHLGHHRPAQGHDALPPRRDGGVRLLAAARAAAPRATTCSSAARRWPSPSAWAGCCCSRCAWAPRPCCWRTLRRTALPAAIAAVPRDGVLHRADLVPRDGAAARRPRSVVAANTACQRRRGAARGDAPALEGRHAASR